LLAAQAAEASSNTATAAIVIGFNTLIVFFIIVFLHSRYNNDVIDSTNALKKRFIAFIDAMEDNAS
jgi:hypothetical protein